VKNIHLAAICRTCAGLVSFLAMILAGNRVTAGEMTRAPHEALSPDVVQKLEAEIKELRGQLPSQSHTMADVAYHFSNLWFAGQARNWPLAEFYWDETRSHLRWAVRVRPVRPLSTGGEFHLADMLAGIEKGPLAALQGSIKAEDASQFSATYKQMLANCYACHVAAEKPYLRLHIPEHPRETMIEFDATKPGSPALEK
jgi:hypothetical protein